MPLTTIADLKISPSPFPFSFGISPSELVLSQADDINTTLVTKLTELADDWRYGNSDTCHRELVLLPA